MRAIDLVRFVYQIHTSVDARGKYQYYFEKTVYKEIIFVLVTQRARCFVMPFIPGTHPMEETSQYWLLSNSVLLLHDFQLTFFLVAL